VTATSITVSVSAAFSGGYGPIISQVVAGGYGTWLADVNAHGGIYGRKVILTHVDNKAYSDPTDGAVAACKQEQSNNSFTTVMVDGVNVEAQCLNDAHVPSILDVAQDAPPSGTAAWQYVHTITSNPSAGPVLATYVKNVLHGGNEKLGVIYVEGESNQVEQGYVAKAKALGMDVVDVEGIQPNQSNDTAELVRLKDAGAQNVAILTGLEALGVLGGAKALDYSPVWTGEGWPLDDYAKADPTLLTGVQAIEENATDDSPAYAGFVQLCHQYHETTCNRDTMSLYGYALVLGKVLEAAGPNPTEASLLAGMNSIKGYNNQILAPLTWGPSVVVGAPGQWPMKCCSAADTWMGTGQAESNF